MGLFSSFFWNEYILLVVDYVSQWAEVVPTGTTNARIVKFRRENIFSRHGMPRLSLVTRALILTIILLMRY